MRKICEKKLFGFANRQSGHKKALLNHVKQGYYCGLMARSVEASTHQAIELQNGIEVLNLLFC